LQKIPLGFHLAKYIFFFPRGCKEFELFKLVEQNNRFKKHHFFKSLEQNDRFKKCTQGGNPKKNICKGGISKEFFAE
jgi:hypothetical protein